MHRNPSVPTISSVPTFGSAAAIDCTPPLQERLRRSRVFANSRILAKKFLDNKENPRPRETVCPLHFHRARPGDNGTDPIFLS
jgi:hypothetical protein